VILKLYGDPSLPETFLFTPDEYSIALSDVPAFERVVTSLFLSNTLFFAGASPGGIEDFLSGLRVRLSSSNRTHFALVPWQADLKIHEERFLSRVRDPTDRIQAEGGVPRSCRIP